MNDDFPQFQWSKFTGTDRNEQYVVRANTFADLLIGLGKVKEHINKENGENTDIADNVTCPVHKVSMQHYINKDGEWWSHKLQDGTYCNGRQTKYNQEKSI
jgi:hypothetical protein